MLECCVVLLYSPLCSRTDTRSRQGVVISFLRGQSLSRETVCEYSTEQPAESYAQVICNVIVVIGYWAYIGWYLYSTSQRDIGNTLTSK